jgi:hypothetical protein
MRLLNVAGFLTLVSSVVTMQAFSHDCCHHGHDCGDGQYCGHPCGQTSTAASAASLQSLEGRIAEIIYLPGATPDAALVDLRLQTTTGIHLVRLAPAGFLKNSGLIVREGDAVAIKGFDVAGMEGDIIVANEIRKDDKTLRLRDRRGLPAW